MRGKNKLSYKYVKQEIEKEGYKLLSTTYKNNRTKLQIQCPENHIYKAHWNSFQQGHRCPICAVANNWKHNWKGGVVKSDTPLFDTYAHQIEFCEEVRRNPVDKKVLQIRCTNSGCRKWFTPTIGTVQNRRNALKSISNGESRFYCSTECKQTCVLYNQQLYPKGIEPYNFDTRPDQADWANMVKERDNHECQKCGSKEKLVAHHVEGLNENPLMSADIDIGITLCKDCHEKVHKEIGCRFSDMRCKIV